MKRFLALILILLPFSCFAWTGVSTQSQINQVVKSNGKPTIVYFTASWCHNCTEMHSVMNDQEVKIRLSHYNQLVVDCSTISQSERTISNKYGVDGLPTWVIIHSDGRVSNKFIGSMSKQEFISNLN